MDFKSVAVPCWRIGSNIFDTEEAAKAFLEDIEKRNRIQLFIEDLYGTGYMYPENVAEIFTKHFDEISKIVKGE